MTYGVGKQHISLALLFWLFSKIFKTIISGLEIYFWTQTLYKYWCKRPGNDYPKGQMLLTENQITQWNLPVLDNQAINHFKLAFIYNIDLMYLIRLCVDITKCAFIIFQFLVAATKHLVLRQWNWKDQVLIRSWKVSALCQGQMHLSCMYSDGIHYWILFTGVWFIILTCFFC